MMQRDYAPNNQTTVLVELSSRTGLKEVAISPSELAEKSAEAVDHAMGTISTLSAKLVDMMSALPTEPKELTVEFGLKLQAEGNAILAKASADTHITVKLTLTPRHN
jgi:hypothetical protein